jgi:hypothetical protein
MTRYAPQWLQGSTYVAGADRRLMAALWGGQRVTGCALSPLGGMQVNIAAGDVSVPLTDGTVALCSSDAPEVVTLAAAEAVGTDRVDVVVARVRGGDVDGGADGWAFEVVKGTPYATGGTPAIPPTPGNATAIGQVLLPGGAAAITQAMVTQYVPGRIRIPAQIAVGVVGYANVTDNGARGHLTFADCPDLAVTRAFPTAAGRLYRYRFYTPSVNAQYTTGNGVIVCAFSLDNGTQVGGQFQNPTKVQNLGQSMFAEHVAQPAAGSHTLAIRAWRGANVTSFNFSGSALVVTAEDIGAVPA